MDILDKLVKKGILSVSDIQLRLGYPLPPEMLVKVGEIIGIECQLYDETDPIFGKSRKRATLLHAIKGGGGIFAMSRQELGDVSKDVWEAYKRGRKAISLTLPSCVRTHLKKGEEPHEDLMMAYNKYVPKSIMDSALLFAHPACYQHYTYNHQIKITNTFLQSLKLDRGYSNTDMEELTSTLPLGSRGALKDNGEIVLCSISMGIKIKMSSRLGSPFPRLLTALSTPESIAILEGYVIGAIRDEETGFMRFRAAPIIATPFRSVMENIHDMDPEESLHALIEVCSSRNAYVPLAFNGTVFDRPLTRGWPRILQVFKVFQKPIAPLKWDRLVMPFTSLSAFKEDIRQRTYAGMTSTNFIGWHSKMVSSNNVELTLEDQPYYMSLVTPFLENSIQFYAPGDQPTLENNRVLHIDENDNEGEQIPFLDYFEAEENPNEDENVPEAPTTIGGTIGNPGVRYYGAQFGPNNQTPEPEDYTNAYRTHQAYTTTAWADDPGYTLATILPPERPQRTAQRRGTVQAIDIGDLRAINLERGEINPLPNGLSTAAHAGLITLEEVNARLEEVGSMLGYVRADGSVHVGIPER